MRLQRFNYSRIVLPLLVMLIIVMATGCSKAIPSAPTFLRYHADVNTIIDNNNMTFSFVFIDTKEATVLEDLIEGGQFRFDENSHIEITGVQLRKGNTYKDARLYVLNLDMKFIAEGKTQLSQLMIEKDSETYAYDIGNWILNIHSGENQHFIIESHSEASAMLNDYIFTVMSMGEEMKIQEIDMGSFSQYITNISVEINDENKLDYENEVINMYDLIEIKIQFDESMDFEQYVFNPTMIYQYGEESFKYIPPYAVYGIPLDDQQLDQAYNRHVESRGN